MKLVLAALCLALATIGAALGSRPASAQPAAPALVGTFTDAETWRAYKARFVTEGGRVVDTANGLISHSEGQGYSMLLAVAANDPSAFSRIWDWTRANLMVRDDQLVAWRWEPERRPAVADMNNATDGDLLIAWALTEAAEAWRVPAYRAAARRIAVEVGRKLVLMRTPHGPLLLPGVNGFAADDRSDGPVVNPSYWVFPAFDRLPLVAPEFDWAGISRGGLAILRSARFGPAQLPTEWVSLADKGPRPAEGFPGTFAYNAIRIPLYLAWAGIRAPDLYRPFLAAWSKPDRRGLPLIDVGSGRPSEWLAESGYGALPAIAACAESGAPWRGEGRTVRVATEHYYPVTLHMLALTALQMRHPRCARF